MKVRLWNDSLLHIYAQPWEEDKRIQLTRCNKKFVWGEVPKNQTADKIQCFKCFVAGETKQP